MQAENINEGQYIKLHSYVPNFPGLTLVGLETFVMCFPYVTEGRWRL